MRPLLAPLLLLLTVLATAGGAQASAPVEEDRCWADWSAAAPIVHRESLLPAKDVRALAQKGSHGQLLNITLCAEKGRYVYRLLILRSAGTVDALTVDARTPFGR
jgi:uncharacterized membrane protein YkoI